MEGSFTRLNSPNRSSLIVNRSLDIYLETKISRNYLKWGTVNVLLLSILLFDLSNKCPYAFSKWYYVEYIAAACLSLSVLYYFAKYFYIWFAFKPVQGTSEQRRLLHFNEGDTSFVIKSPAQKTSVSTPLNTSSLSWNSSLNDSNRAIFSPSWAYNRSSSHHHSFNLNYSNQSAQKSFQGSPSQTNYNSLSSPYKSYSKDDIITDELGLQRYLKEVAKEESKNGSMDFTDGRETMDKSTFNTLWNYCNNSINILKTTAYQLSPTAVPQTKQNFNEDFATFGTGSSCGSDLDGNLELIKSLSPTKLTQYITNLRMYISSTILQRLVKEFDVIDDEFKCRGFYDMKIGSVGLERLKKTAEGHQTVSQHIPTLAMVIPFLDMSTNQEYLVQRIRELAKGSSINDYRWNSSHSTDHTDHTTDAAIIFHLFCAYIDSQLMPLPQGSGRPFYDRYIVWGDKKSPKETLEEVKAKAKCAIMVTNAHKPKFNFISDDKIHNCNHDRNNLFCVIIHFLIFMKEKNSSLLDGVNLGRSGLNILGIIED